MDGAPESGALKSMTWTTSFEGGSAGGAYLQQGLVFSRSNGAGASANDVADIKVMRRADYVGGSAKHANAAFAAATYVGPDVQTTEIGALFTASNGASLPTEVMAACIQATKQLRIDGRETGPTIALIAHLIDETTTSAAGGAVASEIAMSANGKDPNYSRALIHLMPRSTSDQTGISEIGAGIFFSSDENMVLKKAISFGHPLGAAPLNVEIGVDFTNANFSGPTVLQKRGQVMAFDADAIVTFGIAASESEIVGIHRLGGEKIGFDAAGGEIRINGVRVLAERQPAIPDTSDARLAELEQELNRLKALLRIHGLMES